MAAPANGAGTLALPCPVGHFVFLVALFLASVSPAESRGGNPNWWRLRCNGTTATRWWVCNVRFFTDPTCSRALPGKIVERTNSPEYRSTYGVPQDAIYTEYASRCEQCATGEAYLGAKFSAPGVARCVRFEECWGNTPAPAPIATTQEILQPTGTTTPGVPTTTNARQALIDQLGQLLGGGRRLGSATSCPRVMLERSARGTEWDFVAEWLAPQPSSSLNLASAHQRAVQDPPQVLSWNPVAMGCKSNSDCERSNIDGVQAHHTLEVTFSEKIHWGTGNVIVDRGGIGRVVLDPFLDAPWFRVVGNRLLIVPQVSLGPSSSCARITFDAKAIQDSDGEYLTQGEPYSVCIADTVAPTLVNTNPPADGIDVGFTPEIRLEFNEEVMAHLESSPFEFVPQGSPAPVIRVPVNDKTQVRFTSCPAGTECETPGLVKILLLTPLEPETRYELRVPATSISDTSSNAWAGFVLRFVTGCPSAGCAVAIAPTSAPGGGRGSTEPQEESQNIPLYIGIVAGVAVCGVGVLFSWKYVVRNYLVPQEGPKEGSTLPPPLPTPAWTAKSASSSAWRKPVPPPASVHPSQDARGIPVPGVTVTSLNGSSTWGTSGSSASRVTASTTVSSGPRAASWAVPGAEAGWGNAPGGPAAPKQPPAEPPAAQKKRAYTDEDLKDSSPGSSPGVAGAAGSRSSYTEDDATKVGWVRAVDSSSGRTYWYHYKTRETRWEEPPKNGPPTPPRAKPSAAPEASPPEAKASGPAPPPRASAKPPPTAKAAAPSAPPPENTKAGRIKADVLQQLEKTKGEDIASRKKTFRFLCLQWHPDKNQEDPELATEVFQFMQLQRDWYLKE